MEFVLVRHTSVEVPEGCCYGRSDVPLKASFPGEAAAVVRTLASEGPFDAVYTSPSGRCTRLAEACGYREARRDGRLMELDFGRWEMRRWDELPAAQTEAWFGDWIHCPAPDGESFMDQYARVEAFFAELLAQPLGRVLVFCHGGVIACAGVRFGGVPLSEAFKRLAPYGAVVRFDWPR